MWVLYIIGGIMLLAILNEIGLIPEFIGMVALALVSGMISGLVALIFGGRFDSWFNIGILIGLAIFALYCVLRIVNPDTIIEMYSDGTHKVLSERWNGIIGLVVLIGVFLFIILR